MIVIDSSALMAILLDEEGADACMAAIESAPRVVISAGTLAETLIVATRRGMGERMGRMIEDLDLEIAPVTASAARRAASAYEVFGKGFHTATLNFGDCFAYEAAKSRGWPLLFVGDDFSRTDIESALPSSHTGVMSGDLFGRDEPPRQIERLFFGLMLPEAAARAATEVLGESRDEHGLRGHAIRQDRLHITLIHVGDYQGMPPGSVIDALKQAGESMASNAFKVTLDSASSFSGAPGKHPHVLLGDRGVEALRAFRNDLLTAVIRHGVKPLSRQDFNPHVTLSYGDRRLPERPIRPISWRPEEFVLIHSEVGRSIYHTLGRWPLR
ncbi:PIN domain-containing protein [Brevundimonas sp.]|uniref:PIN domain-containing protein n=1 Tax=Brevundimonas sp. TaxID=1871086 RepID=UPI003F7291E1